VANTLKVNETRIGHLIDGEEHTPWLACTLTFDPTLGPILTIPFVYGQAQFSMVQQWTDDHPSVPASLLFRDDRGGVVLTGLRYRSTGGNLYMYTQITISAALFGEPVRTRKSYPIGELRSELDGLSEFTRLSAVSVTRSIDGTRHTVEDLSREVVHWRHAGFTFSLDVLTAPTASYADLSYAVETRTVVRSHSAAGATAEQHIAAQRPMRTLLIMLSGDAVFWRHHEVADRKLPIHTFSGATRHHEFVDAVLARTAEDVQQPRPERRAFPVMTLDRVGSAGLQRWFRLAADPRFWRAINPVAEMINQRRMLIELQVLTTTAALESLGYHLNAGKRTIKQHIQLCIDTVGGDWSVFGGSELVAAAIGNTYNDLKHPDRLTPPTQAHMQLVVTLGVAIVRLVVFHLLKIGARQRNEFLDHHPSMLWMRHTFATTGTVIQPDGTLGRVSHNLREQGEKLTE